MSYLNYKELGEGPPVIISHGLLGMLDNWRTFAKNLAEQGFKVICIDQRNHGKSFHSEDFDYDVLAEDLKVFLDEQGLDVIHNIGHSMGGKMVMKFLQKFPERVAKSVVVDISPSGSIGNHRLIFESLLAIDLSKIEKRKEVETFLVSKGLAIGVVYFLMKNLKRKGDTGGYEWKANIPALWENYDKILAATTTEQPINKPILFAAGENSNYISADDLVLIGQQFPNHSFDTICDAGHWVHADNMQGLLDSVVEFLNTK